MMENKLSTFVGNVANLPNIKFKFDVSQLKSKIEDVEQVTKKTFSAITGLPITSNTKSKKKSKYYTDLKNDTAPTLTEEQFHESTPLEFFQEGFDPVRYILDSIPSEEKDFSTFLDNTVNEFSRSMDYVNSKLYNRVRKNYTEFVEGMAQIHEIGVELQQSTVMCSSGRATLAQTKQNLNHTAFFIMNKYRRRTMCQRMLNDMSQIKSIITLERLMKQSLSDGDYPSTIKMYLECRKTITDYNHYTCITELDGNLSQIYQVVKERVDKDFFNSCRTFNAKTYQRVFTAYKLLNLGDRILDKLQVHFVDPIEPETRNIVYAHVLLSEENCLNPEKFRGVGYKDLCKSVKDEHFVNCLLAVFEYLCDLMTSLYLMNQFHEQNPMEDESKIFENIKSALNRFRKTIWDSMQKQVTLLLSSRKLNSFKIDDFLLVLDSVTKISEIGEEFSGSPSHHLRKSIIDQSKSFFEYLHRSKIDDLRTMLENELWNHIPVANDFNAKTELRLEKRLKSTNSDRHLVGDQLFQAIRDNGNPFSQLISYKNKRTTTSLTITPSKLSPANSSPNLTSMDQKKEEQDSDSEDEVEEYIEEDSDEENNNGKKGKLNKSNGNNKKPTKKEEVKNVLVSSSTIGFVRNIGKYLELMELLPHIATDIFVGICQLVEYYMYTVYSFSGYQDPQGFGLEALTTKMEKTLSNEKQLEDLSFTKPALFKFINRMKERFGLPIIAPQLLTATSSTFTSGISSISSFANLATNQFKEINQSIKTAIGTTNSPNMTSSSNLGVTGNTPNTPSPMMGGMGSNASGAGGPSQIRWITPRINYSGLQLGVPKILFNLPIRVIAIESLTFVDEALRSSIAIFQQLLPSKYTDQINEFYSSVIDVIPDLQSHLIKSAVSAVFSHQEGPLYFSNTIANEKWDIKQSKGVTKSPHVEDFLKSFTKFYQKLDSTVQQHAFITLVEKQRITRASVEFFVQQLVDGYSRVRKCTYEGRGAMIQDVMDLKVGLEKRLPGINISSYFAYADHYLKAYYQFAAFEAQDIIQWAREHEEYPMKHVISIVQLSPNTNINKPQLVAELEEVERKRVSLIKQQKPTNN